ncbi:amino acid ABC transporter permease [Aureimonas phyllosphaerae]|uniref:General L-amino acid transport system permease protein n=1 Tax=Aureimonas phyllosphaerae TaxID=1166078 RepID=A0A7W6BXD7_9HYPH|nr:amino acid ABC transporter permease [Aureimonas phyllosphaerae]MBB3935456.1 general L-amino acid transport system permease protein [Aureimonas phyllosphaerae]MBB3959464.1 general L-amino acid transport system permease protein [Aureimonas phyllosphaerae]SFF53475.1 general L-amino acid transport system permease protein [Aureimonas phyllosphaerae]
MEEQVARFVARGQIEPLPPPASETGAFGTVRKHLFATPFDAVLTIVCGLLVAYVINGLVQWGIVNAVFTGSDRTACLSTETREVGACWAFVGAKFDQFLYGTYPLDERWRVQLVFFALVALIVPIAIPKVPFKRLNAALLFLLFPLAALVLLTGGRFAMSGSAIGVVFALAAAATIFLATGRSTTVMRTGAMKVALWLAVLAFVVSFASFYINSGRILFLSYRFEMLSLVGFAAAVASIVLAIVATTRTAETGSSLLGLYLPTIAALAFVLILTSNFGLEFVPTNLWGGLLITLTVALTGITASLPLGILLALGRMSKMPAVRLLCVIFIEFWRGVPLITVLFMANFMLPLLLPAGVSFNQLLRVLVGVSLFAAAYMAEVIRGGLQAIPKGQYEGADAMALTYWQKMRMIILPQALTLVIPGIVNTFIGLFKDTSLVYIIGLADLLGTIRRGFGDPIWITPSTPATGLVFGAFAFWLFCFSMSRYSIFIERRLARGRKH